MVTLVILDGFGISNNLKGNAIKIAGTPNLDKLNKYPTTELLASGEAVGLTEGQMGNSEVGHLNLGAGKIVYQDLPKINNSIADGSFNNNPAFLEVINKVKKNNSNLHLMGLVSDGGVHSHINHLITLVNLAYSKGLKNVFIHVITDGRDTLKNAATNFVKQLENEIKNKAKIVSVCGRVYAMDREKRWDRVKKAYDMYVFGKCENHFSTAAEAINFSYQNNIFDEFIEPAIIGSTKNINENDGVIFFNYRTDRAREITEAITQSEFSEFETKKFDNLTYCCMTEYSDSFKNVLIAFPPEKIENNLSAIISNIGLNQFHISETTKYAHVTFFFNGGIEEPYKNETRQLLESENVKDYSLTPNMKAYEITENVINAIKSKNYDFILVNLSNADMLGHTGNIDSAVKTIKVIDECAYKIAEAVLSVDGHCIITADHGNAEEMLDENGNVLTQHTTNPVPLWLVSKKYSNVKLNKGKLCNVAPTILKLLEIEIPENMEAALF